MADEGSKVLAFRAVLLLELLGFFVAQFILSEAEGLLRMTGCGGLYPLNIENRKTLGWEYDMRLSSVQYTLRLAETRGMSASGGRTCRGLYKRGNMNSSMATASPSSSTVGATKSAASFSSSGASPMAMLNPHNRSKGRSL